ncbi:hypothetical protein ACA910_010169 [Epithemia clementina (nom. ined.)]
MGADSDNTIIQNLESLYSSLLLDYKGRKRATFVAVPPEVIGLLQGVWQLPVDGDGAAATTDTSKNTSTKTVTPPKSSTPSSSKDRVSRRLQNVQSYSPNLKNYAVKSEGFPCSGADGEIFRSMGKAQVNAAKLELQSTLASTLLQMGYMGGSSHTILAPPVDFHVSFLQTVDLSLAQDPHIDFLWEKVLDDDDDEDHYLTHSSGWCSSSSLSLRKTHTSQIQSSRRASQRHRKNPYMERVPFVAFIPLVEEGMQIEIWKDNNFQTDEKQNDNDETPTGTTTTTTNTATTGVVVDIPFGTMLLARGDVIHAGGFMTAPNGNPRAHLYVYQGGEAHAINSSNTYTFPSQPSRRLNEVYKHAPGLRVASEQKISKFSVTRISPKAILQKKMMKRPDHIEYIDEHVL